MGGLKDWTSAVLLYGTDPTGAPALVAVDADGNIVAVIYGSYAGTLHQIATDAHGRMLSVPYIPEGCFAEGEVVWMDDFRRGLGLWTIGGAGVGTGVWLVADRSLHSGYCAYLQAGQGVAGSAIIEADFASSITILNGVETLVSFDPNVGYFQFGQDYYDGANRKLFAVQHHLDDGELYYCDENGNWTLFDDTVFVDQTYKTLVHYKLVFDYATLKFKHLRVGKSTVDMTGLSGYTAASALGEHMAIQLLIHSLAGVWGTAWVDAVLSTQNEPET